MSVYGVGSSPLTRGKRPRHPRPRAGLRLIPAHAGKTTATPCPSAHSSGSSPLTRGKHDRRPDRRAHARLIPAHAGKTPTCPLAGRCRVAHPRSRGENTVRTSRTETFKGSSPLTRGKPTSDADGRTVLGLIPAHAGKTRRDDRQRPRVGAHPRSRGENLIAPLITLTRAGSSPLTRGKPIPHHPTPSDGRLIPAHAGKTLVLSWVCFV